LDKGKSAAQDVSSGVEARHGKLVGGFCAASFTAWREFTLAMHDHGEDESHDDATRNSPTSPMTADNPTSTWLGIRIEMPATANAVASHRACRDGPTHLRLQDCSLAASDTDSGLDPGVRSRPDFEHQPRQQQDEDRCWRRRATEAQRRGLKRFQHDGRRRRVAGVVAT